MTFQPAIIRIFRTGIPMMSLAVGILATLFFYAYLINNTVALVVAREKAERKATDLQASLAEHEARYIREEHLITLERAYQLGFIDARDVPFLRPSNEDLSLNVGSPVAR